MGCTTGNVVVSGVGFGSGFSWERVGCIAGGVVFCGVNHPKGGPWSWKKPLKG